MTRKVISHIDKIGETRNSEWLLWWEWNLMGQNVWKLLRLEDGTYAVYHRGNRLAEGIPAEWREKEFCVRWASALRNASKSYASSDETGECTLVP